MIVYGIILYCITLYRITVTCSIW